MTRNTQVRWLLLVIANVAAWYMLGFHQPMSAAPPPGQPFANSIEQRAEQVAQLKEIVAELKAQNALLRSGTLQVVVVDPKKKH